jgi:DNA-directed RNA polymerase subunit RPC12/RpoP
MDLSLDVIRKIFKEENSKAVIETFLVEKRFELNHELEEKKKQVEKIDGILQAVRDRKDFSLNLIGDMAKQMERKKKLKKMRAIVLAVGIPAEIIEITTFILGIMTGNWLPFAIGLLVVVLASVWICWFYMKQVSYICPECHKIFIADFWENFWAPHTPNTRKLTCKCCGYKGYCIETYREPGDGENQV